MKSGEMRKFRYLSILSYGKLFWILTEVEYWLSILFVRNDRVEVADEQTSSVLSVMRWLLIVLSALW